VTLSISYGFTALAGLGDSNHGSNLLVPVLGPWIYLATSKDSTSYGSSSGPSSGTITVLGLAQATGMLLLILGYSGTQQLVPAQSSFVVTPVAGGGTYGAAAIARF
jgi:hypothetical protein